MKESVKKIEAYIPGKGSSISIHLDLKDFCQKTLRHGPVKALGEAVFNLCLMANDHFKILKGGAHAEPGRSSPKS